MASSTAPRLAAAAALLVLVAAMPSCTPSPPAASKVAPFVRGYIAVRVPVPVALPTGEGRGHDVFIPRVEVFLLNPVDGSTSAPVTTDLSGRFTLPAAPGRYRVCWKADGFEPGCTDDLSVGSSPISLSTVPIRVLKSERAAAVWGRVGLADGSLVRLLEPYADVNLFARVLLLDATRAQQFEALVNNFGEYLIPQVPAREQVFLVARAEAGEGTQEIRPQANLGGASFHRIDLEIANAPPRVTPLVPRHASGDRAQVANPGETLELRAEATDPDGDPVDFRWLTGAGSLSAPGGDAVSWTLPAAEGLYAVTLLASDRKGGFARHVVSVRADNRGVVFSGRVVEAGSGTPIADARVTVNASPPEKSDSTGFFRLHVPASQRYVLDVRASGFAFQSRIFDRGVLGGLYPLRRATVVSVDPTRDIEVVDRRTQRDCPGPASLRFDAKTFPLGVRPVWQDGKGHVIAPREDLPSLRRYRHPEGCGPGARLRIPAGALEDAAGNAPAGPVEVALSTVDLMSADQMPGDYTVALPAGGTRVMESYGAAVVEISAGGSELNLAPGATAELTIPVDPAQLAAGGPLPPTIPVLFYDEVAGVWREDGSAALAGSEYVATVRHFSAINTDVLKIGQGCVRVDASHPGLPGSFRMQVIVPLGPGSAPRLRDEPIDNSLEKEHVIYNLPTNTNITIAPYDATTGVPYGTFVVDTGGAQNPTDPNQPFGPPYLACSTLVVITPQVLPDDPISGEFLHGLLSFNATELVESDIVVAGTLSNQLDLATAAYYAQVDPTGSRATLAGAAPNFKSVHGFGAGGPGCANLAAGETCAIYANSGDLGFGREMHCKTTGANVACYVTNYGNIATPDADDVAAAVTNSGKVATVAMEYAPIEGDPAADPVVKFFVYNALDNRVNNADLDNKGLRPVPQLCMVCHGGAYPGGPTTGVPPFSTVAEVKLGSEFLAFDLHNYTFAAPPFDKASQQAAFKSLNEQTVLGTNPGPHTALYIAEMYDGDNGVPANVQEELLVIADPAAAAADRWTAQPSKEEMYRHVIGNVCRTCHATNPVPALQFASADQVIDILGSVENRVCVQHVMPHAKVTHDLFWLSADRPDTPFVDPHQPGILEAFGEDFGNAGNGWLGELCGVFTTGGSTPPSAFDDIQDQVFTPECASCHVGGAPPGNVNLQSGSAHAQIVGVASCERPVMLRVEEGSAANSYLFRKVEGSHGGLGGCSVAPCNPFGGEVGCGFQMPWTPPGPASSSPLSAPQLQLIEDWINVGAPN